MHSFALDGSTCWQCGRRQGAATHVTGPGQMKVGDVAICPYCSAISIVDEVDGVLTARPPDTTGPDAELMENEELFSLLFVRMLYVSGLALRKCPQCGTRILLSGYVPRFMDEVNCGCGARLQIRGDYSLGLKEE